MYFIVLKEIIKCLFLVFNGKQNQLRYLIYLTLFYFVMGNNEHKRNINNVSER